MSTWLLSRFYAAAAYHLTRGRGVDKLVAAEVLGWTTIFLWPFVTGWLAVWWFFGRFLRTTLRRWLAEGLHHQWIMRSVDQ